MASLLNQPVKRDVDVGGPQDVLLGGFEWTDPCEAGVHLIQLQDSTFLCLNCKATFVRSGLDGGRDSGA